MHKHEALLIKYTLLSSIVLCFGFLVFSVLTALPLRELLPTINLLVVSAIPMGLVAILALKRLPNKSPSGGSQSTAMLERLVGYYLVTTVAQVLIVLVSAVSYVCYNLPPMLQIQGVAGLALVTLPVASLLAADAGTTESIAFRANRRRITSAVSHGAFIAVLASANYYRFFIEGHYSTSGISAGSPDHQQALSIVFLTLALCLSLHALRLQKRLNSKNNRPAPAQWYLSSGLSLFSLLVLLYLPWVSPLFGLVPLGSSDLAYCVGSAAVYGALTAFYAHNKKHSRTAVLALHRSRHKV